MATPDPTRFYDDLPTHAGRLTALLADETRFSPVPADWHVVVTDIEDSTHAVAAGRHEIVNLIATGTVIAVLNIARRFRIQVPFFFGGDGATLLVPEALLPPTLAALRTHSQNSQKSFDLTLRVGTVPTSELGATDLRIARYRVSSRYDIPVVLGTGLAHAERLIKSGHGGPDRVAHETEELDLTGMECRWDRIKPSDGSHEVVCLLVSAADGATQAPVFLRVIDLIDETYGSPDVRNPVSPAELRLSGGKVALETRVRTGHRAAGTMIRAWLYVQLGKLFWIRSPAGRAYRRSLIDLTDTLVIDGRINTVIAGTAEQRRRLEAGLAALEAEGLLTFGLFVSRESVMSCYVQDRSDKHIHFVDGADGGYTMAARMLKGKRRAGTP